MPQFSLTASGPLHAALILLAAAAVGIPTLSHGLVFDDHVLVGGNAAVIYGGEPLASAFTYRYWGAMDEASPNELYRPITIVSLALDARILGQDAAGMHAVNVLLHGLNATLVYLLIRLLFGRALLALLAGLLFAVHPIATEPVAAVAGRADLLAAFFMLAASLLGLTAARHRRAWIIPCGLGVALVTFMGALSKETMFAAPLVMAAVLGSDARRHAGVRSHYREYLMTGATLAGVQIFVLLMVVILRAGILGYVYRTEPPSDPSSAYLAFVNNPIQFAEPWGRVLTALRVAVMGAGLLAFPVELSADYSYNEIPVSSGAPGPADIAALAFAGIYLALLYYSARRSPIVMFALSWAALTYLIVSNLLFPIGTIFGERLLYMPSIGFAVLVAAGLERLARTSRRGTAAAAALAVVLVGMFSARFVLRCRDWADDESLFAATVSASPDSAKTHSNRGFTLQMAGRNEEAVAEYTRALEIAPGLTGSGVSLARTLTQMGRHQEAIRQLQKVIERDGKISAAWSSLGAAQEATGQWTEAEASFRKSLELSLGGNREGARGLARVMARTGREAEAVAILDRVVKATPGAAEPREELAQAHYQLGVRRLNEGDSREFLEEMRRTVLAHPGHGPARYNLALEALERGDVSEARSHAAAGLDSGYKFPAGFLEACGLAPAPKPEVAAP